MIVTDCYKNLRQKFDNIVLGLGNFDGVHIGHKKLIKEVINTAKNIHGTAAVVTFNPCPLAILDPDNTPPRLLSQQYKAKEMEKLGVDVMVAIPFNLKFAKLTPKEFIENLLHKEMRVRGVVVGYNYTFGYRGSGTAKTLDEYSSKYGYDLKIIPPVSIDGQVVSSTAIRKMLMEGKVELANRFLDRYHFVEGIVIDGDKRGRSIGFPTANVKMTGEILLPKNGVYVVLVDLDDTYVGVANIGLKPTFSKENSNANPSLEVHILDFTGDLYYAPIQVKFLRRLRDEMQFDSENDLINQIKCDIKRAREFKKKS